MEVVALVPISTKSFVVVRLILTPLSSQPEMLAEDPPPEVSTLQITLPEASATSLPPLVKPVQSKPFIVSPAVVMMPERVEVPVSTEKILPGVVVAMPTLPVEVMTTLAAPAVEIPKDEVADIKEVLIPDSKVVVAREKSVVVATDNPVPGVEVPMPRPPAALNTERMLSDESKIRKKSPV